MYGRRVSFRWVSSVGKLLRAKLLSAKSLTAFFASFSIFFILMIFFFLFTQAIPVFSRVGVSNFLFNSRWYPTAGTPSFGIASMVVGSLLVTFIAMIIALPLSLFGAIYISEICNRRIRDFLKSTVEVLAAIPSVVYGFFGLLVLVPWIQSTFNLPAGQTAFTGGVVLAMMVLPTVLTIMEDSLSAVPKEYREASLALGATQWQTIRRVVIPTALPGILAGALLGFGRAIGETIAVTMVTGGSTNLTLSPFSPVRPMPATIALEMGEVSFGSLHYSALFGIGVVLFLITFFINSTVSRVLVRKIGGR